MPNFPHKLILIPGQKKSGTTTLHGAIAQFCPDLIKVPKESGILELPPRVFAARMMRESASSLLLDATTTYFRNGEFPDNMRINVQRFKNVNVLLMHRPESARLASHYRHAVNFDAWTGGFEAFLKSQQYLDHADLNAMERALRGMGIENIRMIHFAELTDPEILRAIVRDLLDHDPGPVETKAKNSFGSRQSIPPQVQAMVANPVFQVMLRPLFSAQLRRRIKGLIARPPAAVDHSGIAQAETFATIVRIDTANAELSYRLEKEK